MHRSTVLRCLYAARSKSGGLPPACPRCRQLACWSARSGITARMPRLRRCSRIAREEYALSARTKSGLVRGRPQGRGTPRRAKASVTGICPHRRPGRRCTHLDRADRRRQHQGRRGRLGGDRHGLGPLGGHDLDRLGLRVGAEQAGRCGNVEGLVRAEVVVGVAHSVVLAVGAPLQRRQSGGLTRVPHHLDRHPCRFVSPLDGTAVARAIARAACRD